MIRGFLKTFLLAAALSFAAAPASAQFADQANVVTNAAGTANAQIGSVVNASSYNDVLNVLLKYTPAATNTGDATLTLNALGTSPHFRKLTSGGLAPLTGNELLNGQPSLIQFDGTYFVIMSASTATLPSLLPQGYLTPCQISAGSPASGCTAGQLLPTGDVTSVTSLYYEPAFGSGMPIWNGSTFVNFTFTELTLTIPSSRLANTLYDVFVALNSNVVTPCFGVAWSSSTAGSSARGTGAGTTQVELKQGVWTNSVSVSCVNGATTFTVGANQGTLVATCWIDGTNGQVSFNVSAGFSRKWACSNVYNKQPIRLAVTDSTASWTYSTNTFRPSNNNGGGCNCANVVTALPQVVDNAFLEFTTIFSTGSPPTGQTAIGIGWNSTSAASGINGLSSMGIGSNPGFTLGATSEARYSAYGALGVNNVQALERSSVSNTTNTFFGQVGSMNLGVAFGG